MQVVMILIIHCLHECSPEPTVKAGVRVCVSLCRLYIVKSAIYFQMLELEFLLSTLIFPTLPACK